MKPPIVLASGSPRRRELLSNLGLSFDVIPADVDETARPEESPAELVRRLSLGKAAAVARAHPDALVLAADTVVVLDAEILGKPADASENRTFVARLAGRTHEVYTGHAVMLGEQCLEAVVKTSVCFRKLSERELDWYARTGEGLDKAGGYAIQGYGAALVSEVRGCYFNVVGLSVATLIEMVKGLGVDLVGAA